MRKLFLCIAVMLFGVVQGMDPEATNEMFTDEQKAVIAVCKTVEAFANVGGRYVVGDVAFGKPTYQSEDLREFQFEILEEETGPEPQTTRDLFDMRPSPGVVEEYDSVVIALPDKLKTPWGCLSLFKPGCLDGPHLTAMMQAFFKSVRCEYVEGRHRYCEQIRWCKYKVLEVGGVSIDQETIRGIKTRVRVAGYQSPRKLTEEWREHVKWYETKYLPAKKSLELAPEPAQALPSDA